jgi:hypothetical protein
VMEKVKVDTEVRKLDQLRSSHVNQQHRIRWQIRSIPEHLRHSKGISERLAQDIATRDANSNDEFSMTVGKRTFSGKGAREEAAKALNDVVLSWRNDETAQVRGHFRGFEIVSRGHPFQSQGDPEIFVRGAQTYRAQLNPENPLGTMQSIEHTLRALDRRAEDEREESQRQEKALAEYKAQLDRPFEHEQRLKELLCKQAELNRALDLDKNERQIVEEAPQTTAKEPASGFAARVQSDRREAAMTL